MHDAPPHIAGEPAQPDPAQDQPGRALPPFIGAFLHAVRVLLGYGRHLAETVEQRATEPDFPTLAVAFGTTRLSAILAHLRRGILRATALERVLLARAAKGRGLTVNWRSPYEVVPIAPSGEPAAAPQSDAADPGSAAASAPAAVPAEPPPAAPSDALPAAAPSEVPPAAQTAADAQPPAADRRARPACRPAFRDDPEHYMPTLEELEAEIRRRPLGRTIAAICLDLGVVFGRCTLEFSNLLLDLIYQFGGDVDHYMLEKPRREAACSKELDRRPRGNWHWWESKREAIRRAVGFLAGETPPDDLAEPPLAVAAAAATGPP